MPRFTVTYKLKKYIDKGIRKFGFTRLISLEEAVKNDDAAKVRELLGERRGRGCRPRLLQLALERSDNTEMVKLLAGSHEVVDDVSDSPAVDKAEVAPTRDVELAHQVFYELLRRSFFQGSRRIRVFEFLLDHGELPAGYREDYKSYNSGRTSPLLDFSYRKKRRILTHLSTRVMDLLNRGADVDKAGENYLLPLYLSMCNGNPVKLPARKKEMVQTLPKHSTRINFCSPVDDVDLDGIIQELAKLKFENETLWTENLQCLLSEDNVHLRMIFENCFNELRRTRDLTFYCNYSLYEILRGEVENLTSPTKNENFASAFWTGWDHESSGHYGEESNDAFEGALRKSDAVVRSEEDKLTRVFKNYLPKLAIVKIAYYVHVDEL